MMTGEALQRRNVTPERTSTLGGEPRILVTAPEFQDDETAFRRNILKPTPGAALAKQTATAR